MGELTGPILGVTLVLTAVFLPASFLPGVHSAPNLAEPKTFLSRDFARHRAWSVARYA